MFNGVAGMVHSSEVNLRLAGVATFGLEQVPFFFRGRTLRPISGYCPSETKLSTLYPCIFDTVYMMTSYTSLQNYGGEQYCHRDLPDWTCGTVSHRI